jgi:hypothetical protein
MRSWLSHALVAAVSVAAMFGLNLHQRPAFSTAYPEPEYVTATGTLSLQRATGDSSDFPLMTTHIVSRDIERVGRSYQLRELLIRTAAPSSQQPSIELYVDIARAAANGESDPQQLVQTELSVMPRGRLGSRSSVVTLGDTTPLRVVTGTLLLTEVTLGEDSVYRARGRLEMQVEVHGGIEMLTARIDGVISWDATGA